MHIQLYVLILRMNLCGFKIRATVNERELRGKGTERKGNLLVESLSWQIIANAFILQYQNMVFHPLFDFVDISFNLKENIKCLQ